MPYKTSKEQKAYNRRYYEKNRKKLIAAASITKKNLQLNEPEKYILQSARGRAKKKGLDFNLDLEDIIIPTHCPLLRIPLKAGEGAVHANSPALDRIDNTKGYIKDNVWVISQKANSIKSNLSLAEFKYFVQTLELANRRQLNA